MTRYETRTVDRRGAMSNAFTVCVGDVWTDHIGEVRVMAVAEGWAMVRRRNCGPFVVYVRDIISRDEWQPVKTRDFARAIE